MRKYNVFADDRGRLRAVKSGFCWPAFFFTVLWAFFRGLWKTGFFLLGLLLLENAVSHVVVLVNADDPAALASASEGLSLMYFLFSMTIRLGLGAHGNKQVEQRLRARGFYLIMKDVPAGWFGAGLEERVFEKLRSRAAALATSSGQECPAAEAGDPVSQKSNRC